MQENSQLPVGRVWTGRLFGIVFGIVLAWMLVEVLLRLFFFSLPPRLQLVLDDVHQTPFTDRALLPESIWISDSEYLTIAHAVDYREQYGNAEVRFTVHTETLWDSRPAFRTRQELVDRRVDAVAVGDSFTFCFTDEADCWVQRFGTLTERNVINLGITSTGAVSHQRVFSNFGDPLQPSLVIWQWFGNDANEDYGLAHLRGETDLESPVPTPPVPERSWWDDNSALYVLFKLYLGDDDDFDAALQFHAPDYAEQGDVRLAFGQSYLWGAFDLDLAHNAYGWERSQQAVLETQAMVEEYGGTLLIILMPTKEQVYREMSEPLMGEDKLAILDKPYHAMRDFCEAENLTCLDLLPVFRPYAAAAEQLYYTTDMHLNPRGNAVLAEALADWVAEHPAAFEVD